jgi:hypothetical protein
VVGEDADHAAAALDVDLFIERIGAPDLFPVRHREIGECGDVVGGLAQHRYHLGQLAVEHAGDSVEPLAHVGGRSAPRRKLLAVNGAGQYAITLMCGAPSKFKNTTRSTL